jgi:hypothetical protein
MLGLQQKTRPGEFAGTVDATVRDEAYADAKIAEISIAASCFVTSICERGYFRLGKSQSSLPIRR